LAREAGREGVLGRGAVAGAFAGGGMAEGSMEGGAGGGCGVGAADGIEVLGGTIATAGGRSDSLRKCRPCPRPRRWDCSVVGAACPRDSDLPRPRPCRWDCSRAGAGAFAEAGAGAVAASTAGGIDGVHQAPGAVAALVALSAAMGQAGSAGGARPAWDDVGTTGRPDGTRWDWAATTAAGIRGATVGAGAPGGVGVPPRACSVASLFFQATIK
jgi:hypothetical protein